MNKKLIIVAIATALAVPMVADAGAVMYGKVRVSTQNAERNRVGPGSNPNSPPRSVDSWGMEDQASRLGVKGDEDLGGGLKAVYKMEFGVNVGTVANNEAFARRNMYVGVAGDFGTFLMGRHDTPFKMSTMDLDFFADTNVDNDNAFDDTYSTTGIGLFDSKRVDGVIAYVGPNFNGLTLMGAVVQHNAGVDFRNDNITNGEDKFAGAYSLAAVYKNGPWFASAAFESMSFDNLEGDISSRPVYDKWRLGAGMLNLYNFSASAIYENRSGESATSPITDSWQISAAYDLMGFMRVKGMYGQRDNDASNFDNDDVINTWAIGLEQNLSKRTDMQILYRQKVQDLVGGNEFRDNVFAIQLDHSF